MIATSARLRASDETATMQQHLPLRSRLARVLLRLAEGFGEPLQEAAFSSGNGLLGSSWRK